MYIYICVQGYMVDPQTCFRLKIVFLQSTTFCLYFLPPLCFQSNNFTVLKMELQSLMVVMLFKKESILSYSAYVCCNPNPLFYLLPSCTRSPQPFNSPIERRWLDRNLRQLTLAYLGSIATRPMWHHVFAASACKGVVNVKNILKIEIQQQSCLWLEKVVRRAPSCLLAHLCLSKSWGQSAWFRVPWRPPGLVWESS